MSLLFPTWLRASRELLWLSQASRLLDLLWRAVLLVEAALAAVP